MAGIEETQYVVETGAEKLARLGKMEIMTTASPNGNVPVIAASYAVSSYKQQERFDITQEIPVDNGQGFQFVNTTNTEV